MTRDIRTACDARETARTRDAAWMLGALDGTGEPRTRTHHIDTETGEFTLLDNQEDTMDAPNEVKIHVTIDREQVREAARLAAELFITEYASRLVEAVDPNYLDDEPVEDCGCPPRVHVNPERTDWLDEPIPVPQPEPADITEEPPVDSRFVDCHGHVWRRGERGWGIEDLIPGSNFDNPWSTVQQYAPLTALEPAPADVDPDEALIDQMVDVIFGDGALSHEGLIEARREIAKNAILAARERVCEEKSRMGAITDDVSERRVNVTITGVFAVPEEHGFLRINVGPETAVIDPNASNVTVTDVEPAPADDGLAEWERELLRPATCCGKCPPIAGGGYDCTCEGNPRCKCLSVRPGYQDFICIKPRGHYGDHGYGGVFWSQSESAMTRCAECETERPLDAECSVCDPAPADVDPDEALARVAFGEYMLSPSWDEAEPDMRKAWIDVARAAREHIEAEDAAAHPVGCGQMIRDVRDGNGFSTQIDGVLIAKCDTYGRTKSGSVANARADKAEADLARVTEERDGQTERLRLAYDALKKAEAKADRYDALRADLEDKFSQVEVEDRGNMPAFASRVLKGILDRDAERDGR